MANCKSRDMDYLIDGFLWWSEVFSIVSESRNCVMLPGLPRMLDTCTMKGSTLREADHLAQNFDGRINFYGLSRLVVVPDETKGKCGIILLSN